MIVNETKKSFVQWLMTNHHVKESTARTYWSHKHTPHAKGHNRAQALFEEFSAGQDDQALNADPFHIERRDKRIALLQSQLEDAKQNLAQTVPVSDVNERISSYIQRIATLELDNTEQRKRLEYYQEQESSLKSQIEDRRRLVVLTFSDGSVMGYPSSLRFEQVEDTIQKGQITGIAMIDVDWYIKKEQS